MSVHLSKSLCQIFIYLPASEFDSTVQMLCDFFGEPTELNQRYTLYKRSKENSYDASGIRIEESLSSPTDVHTITSLSEYLPVDTVECAFYQSALISQVTGSAHAFVSSLRYEPTLTWVERGVKFQHDEITIKAFRVLRHDGSELDRERFGVTFEALSDSVPVRMQSVCKEMRNVYTRLFPTAPFVSISSFRK